MCAFCARSYANTDSLKLLLTKNLPDSVNIKIYSELFSALKSTHFGEAKHYAHMGILLAKKINDKKSTSKFLHNLGTLHYLVAEYPLALNYYLKALKIREELNDSVNIAKSYNNIGLVYYEEENLIEALQYHLKSVAIKEKLKDQNGLASSFGNIGNIYFKWAKQKGVDSVFEKSLRYQLKALIIQEELYKSDSTNTGLLESIAGTYNNLGTMSFERAQLSTKIHQFKVALEYHHKALAIRMQIGDIRGISHSYINIAGVKEILGDFAGSLNDFETALNYARESNSREEIKACYKGMSGTYEKMGNYEKGLQFYKKYNTIKDSILDIAKSEQIAEMQVRFDADKQAKEIELLNKNKSLQAVELKRQTLLRNSFITGFLFVIALVFVIYNRYRLKTKSGKLLEAKNQLIELKNKDITDSIKYAKRIQEAILPPTEYISKLFAEHFVLYKPKDIVSGDFYWVDNIDDKIYFAAVDCTGHGVPGAFISIVGYNLLKHAIHEHQKSTPAEILDQVNRDLSDSLRQNYNESSVKDGMDLSLCFFDKNKMELQYAGANNSIYVISGNSDESIANRGAVREKSGSAMTNGYSLTEYKADKQPIGAFLGEELRPFTNKIIKVNKGDVVYLFTDGYADQFGGPKGKKFKYKQFEEILLNNSPLPMKEQLIKLSNCFTEWRGTHEQIDDVLVMGFRI